MDSSSPPIMQEPGEEHAKFDHVVPVYCRYNFINVEEVDVLKKMCKIKLYFEAAWAMPSLEVSDGNGGTRIRTLGEVDFERAWTPSMVFANKVGDLTVEWEKYDIDKKYHESFGTPMACWRTMVNGHFSVNLSLERFPYDKHDFSVRMSTNHTSDVCVLLPNPHAHSVAGLEQFSIRESWVLVFTHDGQVKPLDHRKGRAGEYPEIVGSISAERNPQYYLANVVLMMFIIVLLSFTIFAMPVKDLGDRLNIIMTLVLTAVAFKLLLAEQLPDLPYLTLLDIYLLGGIFLLTFMAAECFVLEEFVPEEQQAEVDFVIGLVITSSWILINIPLLSPLIGAIQPHVGNGFLASVLIPLVLCIYMLYTGGWRKWIESWGTLR